MKIKFHRNFLKNFRKRYSSNQKAKKKIFQRITLFQKTPFHPSLKNHSLKGKKIELRAFSITGDIRIVYYIKDEIAYFLDIGTHNQVY